MKANHKDNGGKFMQNTPVILAEDLFSLNNTENFLKTTAEKWKNYEFYHYTTTDSLVKILTKDEKGNCFFFVRNISEMNDISESELHKVDGKKIHSFCTCCSRHEKIPLWYLYSGICGRGSRIKFTPANMLKFLNSINVVYPVIDNKVDYSNPLTRKNNDFNLLCGWVYYMDGNREVFYRNKKYIITPVAQEILSKNFFIKDYPWEYEHEFRIVIKNNTKKTFDRVAILIPDNIIKKLKLMSAPERKFDDELKHKLVSLGIKEENIEASKLRINMSLLKNNKDDIVSNIDLWYDEKCGHVCEYISSIQKCNKKRG